MSPFAADIINGECLNELRGMEPDSIDSIITDPPYGTGFMDQEWDKQLPDAAVWAECLRVAKPGAFLLAFGGTRTFHRLACHIEDAGWVLRDCLCWLYGTGFPKGNDISKAIDGAAGADREIIGIKTKPNGEIRIHSKSIKGWNSAGYSSNTCFQSAPATEEARLWDGWNTALKPAWEPILIAMKPCEGTFGANALKWGVAGLNVDQSRIPAGQDYRETIQGGSKSPSSWEIKSRRERHRLFVPDVQGRWPANVVLDGEAAAMLDAQAGDAGSHEKADRNVRRKAPNRAGHLRGIKEIGIGTIIRAHGGNGGPSRFFYCSKPSAAERGASRHPTQKPLALMRWLCRLTRTPTGGVVLDPFMGSGTTGVAALLEERGFVGIEREAEYCALARERIRAAARGEAGPSEPAQARPSANGRPRARQQDFLEEQWHS